MQIIQKSMSLKPYPRGFHLVTREILEHIPELKNMQSGILYVVLQHTSAGLSIDDNAAQTVRIDFEYFVNDLVPEAYPHFVHTFEGADDMPAHLKTSIIGNQVHLPITAG